MITIFMSYRRDDTLESTAHLFRSLQRHYTRDEIFFDLYRESPGATLPDKLAEFVSSAEALIAVIGRGWEHRLANEWDAVRYELEIALRTKVPVFPVLVQGASMPAPYLLPESIRALSHREALTLRALEFDGDVDRLIAAIDAERNRRKHEASLSAKMEAAAAISRYTEAIQIAESIIPLTRDNDVISIRLTQLRLERQHRVDETSGTATASDQELAAGRIESAMALCETALSVLPDEAAYVRLQARIQAAKRLSEQRERESHHRELIERASRAAKNGALLEFAELAQQAIQAGASSHPELQKLLHAERFRLRRALLKSPRNVALGQMYLQSRDEQLERRDRVRERVILASIGILILYGFWAIVTLAAWHWFKPPAIEEHGTGDELDPLHGGLISYVARATIPMFVIGWIVALVITDRAPWGDEADPSEAAAGSIGCLFVFGIPAGLIFLLKNDLDFLLIPIYGIGAAWLIKKCSEPGSSNQGPRPIWPF